MPNAMRLTHEDRVLLRQAYSEGILKLAEADGDDAKDPARARRLEQAGLLRSIAGMSGAEGRVRYFALSGAGICELG